MFNPVAKYAHRYNKSIVIKSKKSYSRNNKGWKRDVENKMDSRFIY